MTLFDLVSQFSRYVHRIGDIDVTQMCGLARGTNTATIQTSTQVVYNLYNQQYTLAATNNLPMTACAQQAVSTFCYYLVSANVSGGVVVTKGTDNTYGLPATPPGAVAMGALRVTTDATHTFTSGTTDLAATGITATFYDIDTGIAAALINQAQRRLERGVTIVYNGRQHTISDFDHMLVNAQETINQGDSSVVLPFPGYKDFADDDIILTDQSGLTYPPMEKGDILPTGVVFQARPLIISRMPPIETVFTPNGWPAKVFNIWPQCDETYTMQTIAYCYSPDLDGVIYPENWLTTYAPDILLFGALVEFISYGGESAGSKEWKERWNEAVWTLYVAQSKEKYSGSPIYPHYKNPLADRGGGLGMSTDKAGIMSFGYAAGSDE